MKKIIVSFVSVLMVSSLLTVVLAANAISCTDKLTKQVILSEEAPAPVPEPAPAPAPAPAPEPEPK
jgi:hypothetical protein